MRFGIAIILFPILLAAEDGINTPLRERDPNAPSQAALRFHEALLKSPHNATLFGRFHDAWLDDQSVDSLAAFLTARAEKSSGADLALLARFQIRRGMEDAALATLAKASGDPALMLERGRILLNRLEFKSAREDLETVAKSPDPAIAIEAGKLIGKSHLREGNPDAATAAWEKLIAAHPTNTEIMEDLVELTASLQQSDQAIAYSRRLIESTADAFRKTQHKLRLGELLAESGKSEEAIALWSETLSQTGEGSWLEREIISRISTAYRRLDRIDSLSGKLVELAAANPRRLLLHRELAKLEAANGELDSAIGRFQEVLRRSPGDSELREEFIRLIIEGNRFDEAAEELRKLIARSPKDPDLHLRMADLAKRRAEADPAFDSDSPPSPDIAASLAKALELMPPGESSGTRIAGLMLTYGLHVEGEKLLSDLISAPGATSAPAETLAAEYARTNRKKEALALLTKVAQSPDADTVLRATSAITSLGDSPASFAILNARLKDFPNQAPYLTALANASLAAKQSAAAVEPTLRLIRLSKLPQEILDATRIATSVITAAEKTDARIAALTARKDLTAAEICLLATLLETRQDTDAADAFFKDTTDPTLLRFHASLLSRRGDPQSAIAALRRLSQDKSKPDFLKELAELQLRAGLIADCLATLAEWQTAAPTAREPWTIAVRLHRDTSNIPAAIETSRRALTRFPGDEDFTANLADLHQLAGDNAESERIFWKLYDQAPDTTAQSRWATRLSMLAQRTGTTDKLAENLLARARSNPQSTGPILALVELARTTGDREAIIGNLARALFIKPTDIEIRINLANAQSESGNREAAIATLSEGTSKDPAGRIRTALARTHIDGGDVMKGLRILRSLAGEKGADPRSVETIVESLLTTGNIAEAIQYMQESLPGGGDWRTKYLLASLLCEDGREIEAIPIFLGLLSEEKEIPALSHNPRANHRNYHGHLMSPMYRQNPAILGLSELFQAAQNSGRIREVRQVSQTLPYTVAQLGTNSLIQLAMIASSGNLVATETILAANPPRLALTIDLINAGNSGQLDMLALLEKHPEEPGLFDLAWSYGSFQGDMAKHLPLLKRILAATDPDQHSHIPLLAAIIRLEPDEPRHWDGLIASASVSIRSENPTLVANTAQYLYNFLTSPNDKTDPKYTAQIKALLLAHALKPNQPPDANGLHLHILAIAGTREQWITAVNESIAAFRAAPKPLQSSRPPHFQPYYDGQEMNIANTLPLLHFLFSSFPPQITNLISGAATGEHVQNGLIPVADLLGRIERFESSLLRSYIAVLSGDEKAIEKYLNAPHPEIELADLELLRASREISADRMVEALRIHLKLRESEHLPARSKFMVNSMAISIARKLTTEQRAEFGQPLRATLNALIPPPGPYRDVSGITAIAKEFGFDDIVKSLAPTPPPRRAVNAAPVRISLPAAITPPATHHRQQASHNPIDRFREFARLEKTNAAAREFLTWLVSMNRSGSGIYRIPEEILSLLTPAIRAEVLALTDPGSAPGLTKRRQYIAICLALGERDKALAALSALADERPFDPSITCELAFLLPPAESNRANKLLTSAAGSPFLSGAINSAHNRIWESREKAEVLAFFGRIASLLEAIPPEHNPRDVLNQISNISHGFFASNTFPDSLPLITAQRQADEKRQPPDANHIAVARHLAIAMLRQPTLTDSGFGFLKSASWEEKPSDLDEWARSSILLVATHNRDYRNYQSSSPYPGKSPIEHLLSRIADSAPDLLPAAYLDSLTKFDPHLPMLLRFHATPATTDTIANLWDSGAFEPSNSNNLQTLRESACKHAAAAPGAARFFLSRLTELSKKKVADPANQGAVRDDYHLVRAILETCSGLDEKGTGEACAAIIAYLTPGDPKMSGIEKINTLSNSLSVAMNGHTTDPRTTARIIRAFDSTSTPLPDEWLRSNLRKMQMLNAVQSIEALGSMGLLAEAAAWKPLAAHLLAHDYSSGKSELTIKRSDQLAFIAANTYSTSREKIAKALEDLEPQVFGSLIAAAHFATGSERERLAAAAFKRAAPVLAKADARRTADFALLLPLLHHSATATLPPGLRAIAEKSRADTIDALVKTAEQRIAEAVAGSQNPLQSVSHDEICKLADLDHTKATGIFLKAAALSLESANAFTRSETSHEAVFSSILRSITPEAALRFHQAVLASPIGARFGISGTSDQKAFLSTIGESIESKIAIGTDEDVYRSEEPWLTATRMPPEIRMDALAALACDYLQRLKPIDKDKSLKPFVGSTHPDIRSFAVTVISMTSWNYDEPKVRDATSKSFLGLLAHPDLNANARTQIALTAASSYPAILRDPAIAEAVANIFAAHCERDASVVANIPLLIVHSICTETIPPAALPHLKRINDAFWKNANAPITGGHQPVPEFYTLPLFQSAVAVGDSATVKRLFPTVQPSLSGKLMPIHSMVSSGHFDFAAALLPDDNTPYGRDIPYYDYTPEFHRQIIAFRESGVNPTRLLRLECALLEMPDRKGRKQSSELTEESRKHLIAAYAKNPPTTAIAKIEILHALATSTDPASNILSAELINLADTLNPTAIMNDWAKAHSSPHNLLADSKWDILCKVAANKFASGDATPFVTLMEAITKYRKVGEDTRNPSPFAMYGLFPYILPATCTAIANVKTGGFSAVIEPLGSVAKSLPKDYHALAVETLALCEFLAYWESNPAAFARILRQISGNASENIKGKFSFPRNRPPFLNTLARYNQDRHPSLPGLLPEGFPIALFSHAPISDLLPSMEKTWLGEFSRSNLRATAEKLALEEFPESITPAGRALLLIHRANQYRNAGRRNEVHEQYRASLDVMPPGKAWDYVRTHTRCHVVWEMLEKGKVVEARELFDSIMPAEISEGSKSFYESLSKSLKTKEHRPD